MSESNPFDRKHKAKKWDHSSVFPAMDIEGFLSQVVHWAMSRPDCAGLALVGSYARGEATSASDIDLVFITDIPEEYLENTGWTEHFGKTLHMSRESWGKVKSIRVCYADGYEVEFGITDLSWISLPLEEGTARAISEGMVVLFEKDHCLTSMIKSMRSGSEKA